MVYDIIIQLSTIESSGKMDLTSEGCRLCLDPSGGSLTPIDNPELQDQMKIVFCFSIEFKQGCSSGVCQSCSYAICEFYQYSEKVRQNQEVLDRNLTTRDLTADSQITYQNVKIESISDSEYPETPEQSQKLEADSEEAEDPKNVVLEEFPTVDSKITPECVTVETMSDSEILETTEDDFERCEPATNVSGSMGEKEVPTLESSITIESVKIEPLSDSELLKTTEDGCESPSKNTQTQRLDRKKLGDSEAGLRREQERIEDELFNKHFRMICGRCGITTATYTELLRHSVKEHNTRRPYLVCCNKKLFFRSTIRDHIQLHADPDLFRCKVCRIKYKNRIDLSRHIFSKHSDNEQVIFKCEHCPTLLFSDKVALIRHMKKHERVNCSKCNKTFARRKYLIKHMKREHSDENQPIVCDICGKAIHGKEMFEKHMNGHKRVRVNPIQCGICQRWLKNSQNLRTHMWSKHTNDDMEFRCDICQKIYPNSQALYAHKSRTHADLTHECEFCGKKFKKATALKEHRTTHTGEFLYKCVYCGIQKKHKSVLYKHTVRYHPREWAVHLESRHVEPRFTSKNIIGISGSIKNFSEIQMTSQKFIELKVCRNSHKFVGLPKGS